MLSVFSTSAILGCIFVSHCGFNLCFPGLSENQDVFSDRWWWKASLTVITVSAFLFYLHQMLSPISFQFLSFFLIFLMFLKFSVYLCLSFFKKLTLLVLLTTAKDRPSSHLLQSKEACPCGRQYRVSPEPEISIVFLCTGFWNSNKGPFISGEIPHGRLNIGWSLEID